MASWIQVVRVATTENIITLSGTQSIDDVATSAGDRVLVKDQTDRTKNGVYVVSDADWDRAPDAANGTITNEMAVRKGRETRTVNTCSLRRVKSRWVPPSFTSSPRDRVS